MLNPAPQGSSQDGKVSGVAWAELQKQERAASQSKISKGPALTAETAQTAVHKVLQSRCSCAVFGLTVFALAAGVKQRQEECLNCAE